MQIQDEMSKKRRRDCSWLGIGLWLAVLMCGAEGQTALKSVQERGGLPNIFAKLRDGKPVTVVYFGRGHPTVESGLDAGDRSIHVRLPGPSGFTDARNVT